MDINEKLEQTNTFVGGMNTDTSDLYLKSNEYRLAKNLRAVADGDSNTGELHMIDGVWPMGSFDDVFKRIYATTKIRNYGIIIGETESGTWSIYRYDNDNPDDDLKLIFGPSTDNLNTDQLSLVTRWESNNNVKLYIADGEHELMQCFIDDEHLEGEVPTTISEITSIISVILEQPTLHEANQAGSLKSPVLQYAYLLYNVGGSYTTVSPTSKPIILYNSSNGYEVDLTISKSVSVTIQLPQCNATHLRLYRISYIRSGQEPTIDIIYDDRFEYNDYWFLYIDSGSSLESITEELFISLGGTKIKPLLLESKGDYLFCGNVQYTQDEVDALFDEDIVKQNIILSVDNNDRDVSNGTTSFRSLMPGEKYRYGVVLYDNLGRRSSVIHLEDLTVPDTAGKLYYVKATYSRIDNCSAIEIVRCDRTINDSKTISLGIVARPFKLGQNACYNPIYTLDSTRPFMSPYVLLYDNNIVLDPGDENPYIVTCSNDLIQFTSPEYCYLSDDVEQVLKNQQLTLQTKYEYKVGVTPVNGTESRDLLLKTLNSDLPGSYFSHGVRYTFDSDPTGVYFYIDNGDCVFLRHRLTDTIGGTGIDHPDEIILFYYPNAEESTNLKVLNNSVISAKQQIEHNTRSVNISDYTCVQSPKYNSFDTNGTIQVKNDSSLVGNYTFFNWCAPLFLIDAYPYSNHKAWINILNSNSLDMSFTHLSTGGKCILLLTNSMNYTAPSDYTERCSICVANLQHEISTPYGGDAGKKYSIYRSFGNYFDVRDVTEPMEYIVNDGDVFLGLFRFNSSHAWISSTYRQPMFTITYNVPVYSKINMTAVYGKQYYNISSQHRYLFQDDGPIKIGDLFVQDKPAYLYNTVYSSLRGLNIYTPSYRDVTYDSHFDTRIIYSNLKTNNERTDSWASFPSALFLDVDSRYGELTHLKLFNNQLMYWQKDAVGVLSVNERTILQDLNESNIILGNTGVLQRYDYITTVYGMRRGDKSSAQSQDIIYWWDYLRKEMVMYAGGQQATPMNKLKNISVYINKNNLKNKPAVLYDEFHDEILFDVVDGGALAYNEPLQKFISVYDITFDYSIPFEDRIILINGNSATKLMFYDFREAATDQNGDEMYPSITYVVNENSRYVKTFDTLRIGGDFYESDLTYLNFMFNTPTNQRSIISGSEATRYEYDYRMRVPRAYSNVPGRRTESPYGGRLRGKTMQCEMSSTSNSTDFSLRYITTKFRLSWS